MFRRAVAWYKRPNKSVVAEYVEAFIVILPLAFFIRTFFYGLYKVPTGSMETTMLVGEGFVADKLTIWFQPIKRGEIIAFNDPTYDYSTNPLINWWQRYVWGPSNWTKRVIGLPGEKVRLAVEDGKPVIYINDVKLDEPYVNNFPLMPVWLSGFPTLQDLYLAGENKNCKVPTYRSYDPNKPFDQQPFYRINPAHIDLKGWAPIRYPNTPLSTYHIPGDDEKEMVLGENEYWVMGDNRLGSWDSRGWGILDGILIHGRIKFRLYSFDSDESWFIVDLIKHPIDFWKRVRWSRCMQWVY